eukprot:c19974_g3_i1.p1 GENE.c19974_g3_i1~~c19974_g3_i1.p1  ORF type:complete len:343 (+),score=59.00 c19974_g3_i1:243-1271(+)
MLVSSLTHDMPLSAVTLSQDGKQVIFADHLNILAFNADQADPEPRYLVYHAHESLITSLAMFPDDSRFVSTSLDCTLKIWDAFDGALVLTLAPRDGGVILDLDLCPTTSKMIAATTHDALALWNYDGESLPCPLPTCLIGMCAVAFAHKGASIVTACTSGEVTLWDSLTGSRQFTFSFSQSLRQALITNHQSFARICEDGTTHVWDAATHQVVDTTHPFENTHIVGVAATNSGKCSRVAVALSDGSVVQQDVLRHVAVRCSTQPRDCGIGSIAISANATRIVTTEDCTVNVWESWWGKTQRQLRAFVLGSHPRAGRRSCVQTLPPDLIEMIAAKTMAPECEI